MKGKILITYRIPEESLDILKEKGYSLIWPALDRMTEEEILSHIKDCTGVVSLFGTPFPDKAFEVAKTLKIISNYGAGVDNINLSLATQYGVVVTNTPDEVTVPTAEMAVALMLALARRIPELDRRLRSRNKVRWGVMENLGTDIGGKTLGIIGLGRIGQAAAGRALALGMNIVYHNRSRVDSDTEHRLSARYLSFNEILETADVLSLHVPLTAGTYHMIDRKALIKMKKSALLINTARGAVIDEKALITALRTGDIAGAALDVFENEPRIPEGLLKLDNVVIVPHIGTATLETRIAIGRRAATNILEFLNGKDPVYCVNPEVLDKIS